MKCKLCDSDKVKIIYNDVIRNGGLGRYTDCPVPMYQCGECGTIWHEPVIEDLGAYYESPEYRAVMDEGSDEETFYLNHDRETLEKFKYTGTDIFRHKVVADIGCGAGAFLDFLKGVASEVIAIEPSGPYREIMRKKGFSTYAYARDAIKSGGYCDVVTSFDVIEHVEDPAAFVKDAYDLLGDGGTAIIGTPTDAPIMRSLLGKEYEKQLLFSTQHLWIFSGDSLRSMAEKAGFKEVEVRYFQRYGIENVLGWCLEKRPRANVHLPAIEHEVDGAWRGACSGHSMADYVVLYGRK